MATPPTFDPDTVAIASATSDVALSDLVVSIAIVQAVSAASYERAVIVEVVSW
jgi:hypothetical protein